MSIINPKVTILLATYNRAHLIGETLDSILNQTYENWECVIVDDYSIDDTYQVINNYLQRDGRFSYYLKTENYKKGLSGSRNYGLDIALQREAKFIQLFDDDDIMHPYKLEFQIEPFKNDKTLDLTICCYRKFSNSEIIEFDLEKADDKSCNIHSDDLLKDFYLGSVNLNSSGPLWKLRSLKNYRFIEDLKYGEEQEFYLRIFLNEKLNYFPVNKILFWYRKHEVAITSTMGQNQKFKEDSMELVRNEFLKEILKQDRAPFYLLKSYVAHGVRKQKKEYVSQVKSYLVQRRYLWDLKYFLLLLSIKFPSVWKVKRN